MRLKIATDPGWTKIITDNFDEFLADHADCERKASAMALNLIAKCPDRSEIIRPLIDLSLEELTHFRQVYDLMKERGVPLNPTMEPDPYINRLLALCRSDKSGRFMDKMIAMSVVEARGAERFGLVAEALEDPVLKKFYQSLYVAEAKHGSLFVRLCKKYFKPEDVDERLNQILEEEARIVQTIEWRPSLH